MPVLTGAFPGGRYIHYGIREHAMVGAMNGMVLHGGIVPYFGTFLVFSDYCRPSLRLAALMHLRVILVITHDRSASARMARRTIRSNSCRAAGDPRPASVPSLRRG